MKTSLPFLLCSVLMLFSSCTTVTSCHTVGVEGSGRQKSVQREVENFTAVDVSGACDVEIVCQKSLSVEVQGDDNLVQLVKTEVRNGTLYISHEKSFSPKQALRVLIAVPTVESVELSGAGSVRVLNLRNKEFSIDVSGAASVYASGTTEILNIDVSGATDVETKDLHAEIVRIDVSGASNAEVFASKELEAEVSGVGNITYFGNPKVVQQDVSGVGSISKK